MNNFWRITESCLKLKDLIVKIASNVTDKILRTVFSKFTEENFMKERKLLFLNVLLLIPPIDILVQAICESQVMRYRNLFSCTQEKKKLRVVEYLDYSN